MTSAAGNRASSLVYYVFTEHRLLGSTSVAASSSVSAALSSSFDVTKRKAKAAEFFHPVIEASQMSAVEY